MDRELAGDRESFRALFEAHKEAVYRYLYRLSRNRHDAEDLLQETFARF
ncbi:MAG: RNA polymerase sigma factor, partial [Planctomycetota bacterium]|nr:RNA polymerase sigma factor [Planctomycetota bacterium]